MIEREIPEHFQTIMFRSQVKLLQEATNQKSTKDALREAALDCIDRYLAKKQRKEAKQETQETNPNTPEA